MSISIQPKTNYSFLFNSLGNSSSGGMGNLNFLSDYASIKNGSYGKLLKAYYNQQTDSAKSTKSTKNDFSSSKVKDETKTLAKMQDASDNLKESADQLLVKGDKALFKGEKLTEKDYSAVGAFVSNYNSVLSAADKINSTNILSRTEGMTKTTGLNESALNSIGITINKDNSLSINKEAFMNSKVSSVKNLFNVTGGYGYQVSAQASLINFTTDNEATRAKTYTDSGSYAKSFNAGAIFNAMF